MATLDSTALPPAFPPWMREADPILAAEDTNGLFQAFRARRLAGRSGGWPSPRAIRGLGATAAVALAVRNGAVPLAVVALAVAEFLRFLRLRQMRAASGLPPTLSEFLSLRPAAEGEQSSTRDQLLLIPLQGSEVAEALYLEHREAAYNAFLPHPAIHTAVVCGYLVLAGVGRSVPVPVAAAVLLMSALISRRLARLWVEHDCRSVSAFVTAAAVKDWGAGPLALARLLDPGKSPRSQTLSALFALPVLAVCTTFLCCGLPGCLAGVMEVLPMAVLEHALLSRETILTVGLMVCHLLSVQHRLSRPDPAPEFATLWREADAAWPRWREKANGAA